MAEFIVRPGNNVKRVNGRFGGEHPGHNDDRKVRKSVVGTQPGKRTVQRLQQALTNFEPGDEESLELVGNLDQRESRSHQHASNRDS